MPLRDDPLRLADMLAAARDASRFATDRCEADLHRDRQLALALLKCIEIVGEAAARIGTETRARHKDLPWNEMVGMRNRLVHNYFDVDLSLLWTTVTDDLPALIAVLERIVERK
jgi:uncharacterized protein with HEPN domain